MFNGLRTSLTLLKKNLNYKQAFLDLKNIKTSVPKNNSGVVFRNESKNKTIGLWLAGCSGMVAGAVVLGGLTR